MEVEDDRPLYVRLTDFLRARIAEGTLVPGDGVPPYRTLSRVAGVSEITTRRALVELVREGLLMSRPGSGTFVANTPIQINPTPPREAVEPAAGSTFGLVLGGQDAGSPFLAQSVRGFRRALSEAPRLLFFEQPEGDPAEVARFAETVPLGELRGLLMYSPVNMELVLRCRRARVPYVLMWNDAGDGVSPCVVTDFALGVLEAVRHLARTGRRRIAMVTAPPSRGTTGRRIAALRVALAATGLGESAAVLAQPGYTLADGRRAMVDLLAGKHGPPPTAVLFASDQQATGGVLACRDAGISVPEDIAIVGMGNVLGAEEVPLPLTTIDLRAEQLGEQAAQMLDRLRQDVTDGPLREVLLSRLIVRESA